MSKNSKKRREQKKKRSLKKQREDRIHHSISPMPPEFKKELLPYAVVKLLTGGQITPNHRMKPDLVRLFWNEEEEILHVEDFQIVKAVADSIWKEHVEAQNLMPSLQSIPTALELHHYASKTINKIVDCKVEDKTKVIFIKDQSGCGYWRMVVPARYIHENVYIDMAEIEVVYDYLLEYDVIVVQRLHTWREFYTIERLKRQGKRIVYDIDDDIFNIPDDNIASRIVRLDQQNAAKAIMSICDVITTTNSNLKERLGFPDKTIIVPNAIDMNDGYPQKPNPKQDEFQRIVWMGSHTHERDWLECFEAIDRVLKERENVRLTLLGYCPKMIQKHMNDDSNIWWDKRVEFMDFQEAETYIKTTKQLVADVALAPLEDRSFNHAKSNIKWLEYTAACVPTVASNVFPYNEYIENEQNGFLAETSDDWHEYITQLLDKKELRIKILENARSTVDEHFDIKKVVYDWEHAIFGDNSLIYDTVTEE